MIIYITTILLFISFAAKAFMDTSAQDGFSKSWLNKTESWQNKYSLPLSPNYKHWYYFGLLRTTYRERFIFSSTLLVILTNGWHLLQFIFLNCLFIALALNMGVSIYGAMFSYLIIRFIYSITYNSFYR